MMPNPIQNVDDYLIRQPVKVRTLLEKMRHTILKAAPGADEVISYNMPAFKYHGMLVWIAAHKNHIGFYPRVSAIQAFKKEISVYKWAKGSVQFPFDKPLPLKLITKIVKYRMKENLERVNSKKKKK